MIIKVVASSTCNKDRDCSVVWVVLNGCLACESCWLSEVGICDDWNTACSEVSGNESEVSSHSLAERDFMISMNSAVRWKSSSKTKGSDLRGSHPSGPAMLAEVAFVLSIDGNFAANSWMLTLSLDSFPIVPEGWVPNVLFLSRPSLVKSVSEVLNEEQIRPVLSLRGVRFKLPGPL